MHETTHRRARLAANGNHPTTVSHRDRHVGHAVVRVEALHGAFEQRDELSFAGPQFAS